ncbi:MAG: 5'-methylthioadenosine/adenosylhomocysteine nucleosidase [Clostridium sp.]|nr:5'-methylthioadenosine/adenosylhomocysteine nucleosidase [Clostridium sp.]
MIGIIGAMESEVLTLKEAISQKETICIAQMDFTKGTIADVSVVVVRCGIGKVNAALCMQILVDHFGVTCVINTGAAGSLNATLNIGDILISKEALQHDIDVTPLGYQPGVIPQLETSIFKANERMVEMAQSACARVLPEIGASVGRVLSGDQFISDPAMKDRLCSLFQGDCAEMEGAAIAQGAMLNGIPFLILRSISDKADGSAHMEYPEFEKRAAMQSAKVVLEIIKSLVE